MFEILNTPSICEKYNRNSKYLLFQHVSSTCVHVDQLWGAGERRPREAGLWISLANCWFKFDMFDINCSQSASSNLVSYGLLFSAQSCASPSRGTPISIRQLSIGLASWMRHANALFCFPWLLFKTTAIDPAWTVTGARDLSEKVTTVLIKFQMQMESLSNLFVSFFV